MRSSDVYDEKVWAMLGSISGDSTHIALRVSLRAELPIVNSAATDPTFPKLSSRGCSPAFRTTACNPTPWAPHLHRPGTQARGPAARHERYGRFGVLKFRDASRRLGHPVVIEQKFAPGDTSFTRQLRVINDSRVDGSCCGATPRPPAAFSNRCRKWG